MIIFQIINPFLGNMGCFFYCFFKDKDERQKKLKLFWLSFFSRTKQKTMSDKEDNDDYFSDDDNHLDSDESESKIDFDGEEGDGEVEGDREEKPHLEKTLLDLHAEEEDEEEGNLDDDGDEYDFENQDTFGEETQRGKVALQRLEDEEEVEERNADEEEEDDEDDEDEDEALYLQKFNRELKKDYIQEFHPECFMHNYDEISVLTQIVRDSHNNIVDPLHQTLPFLTKYEKARILGMRAKQINQGAKPLVPVPTNIIEGHLIALMELEQKRLPFIIRRPLPGGASEYWNVRDLENVAFD